MRSKRRRAMPAVHPGELIREEILPDMGIGQGAFAERLGVSRRAINEIVREKRGVSPDMALRLGRLLGSTPEFWMRLQARWDLERAEAASSYKKDVRPGRSQVALPVEAQKA